MEPGTCAEALTVEQAPSGFVNRLPNTPARPATLARLRQLEDDPDRRPVRCR